MSEDYLLGLLTIPAGVAGAALCVLLVRGAYLMAGKIGRLGIIRLGHSTQNQRYRYGACVAASKRVVLLNRGSTGMVFFTGEDDGTKDHIFRLDAAMARADWEPTP